MCGCVAQDDSGLACVCVCMFMCVCVCVCACRFTAPFLSFDWSTEALGDKEP